MENSGFLMNDKFILYVLALGDQVANSMLQFLPLICIIIFTWAWAKHALTSDGSFDIAPLFDYIFTLIALMTYKEWMGAISQLCGAFCQVLGTESEIYKTLTSSADMVKDGQSTMEASIWDTMDTWIRALVLWIADGAVAIIRIFFERLRLLALAFMYVVGPISILLSPLPNYQGLGKRWLNGYLGIQAWALTMIVVDKLVSAYTKAHVDANLSSDNIIEFVGVNCVFIAMYISLPLLTSFWLMPAATNNFMGKMAAGAALVGSKATQAGKVISRMAGGISKAGGNAVMTTAAYSNQAGKSVSQKGISETARTAGNNVYQNVARSTKGAVQSKWNKANEKAARHFTRPETK